MRNVGQFIMHSVTDSRGAVAVSGRDKRRKSMIEHLTLTEQEIVYILRRNDEHFARRVLAFSFGMDKTIWRNSRPLDEKYSIAIHG